MRSALEFLKLATERWTPPVGMRHSFTQLDGALVLSVVLPNGTMQIVNFEDVDLDKTPALTMQEISHLFEKADARP